MQARLEVRNRPVRLVVAAVVLAAALLIGLAALSYAIQVGGSSVPAGPGATQVKGHVGSPVEATDTRVPGKAQDESVPFVVEQAPDGLSVSSECTRFGGPRC